jgi:tetratricopeptide (TPR) repeat protein
MTHIFWKSFSKKTSKIKYILSKKTKGGESTIVDLGSDLLGDPVLARAKIKHDVSTHDIPDLLLSAQILRSEGFIEEAKKNLRTILRLDSGHLVAQKKLESIHAEELEMIFDEVKQDQTKQQRSTLEMTVKTLENLTRDLKLGEDKESGFFSDADGQTGFQYRVVRSSEHLSDNDRLDLALSFTQMGLISLAQDLLKNVPTLSAKYFVAQTYVDSEKFFEALMALEAILADTELLVSERVHFHYLMGRSYEGMGQREPAMFYYHQVVLIEPHYRDARDRMEL